MTRRNPSDKSGPPPGTFEAAALIIIALGTVAALDSARRRA